MTENEKIVLKAMIKHPNFKLGFLMGTSLFLLAVIMRVIQR